MFMLTCQVTKSQNLALWQENSRDAAMPQLGSCVFVIKT